MDETDAHVAAIDQGTTGTRCLVVDRDGRVAGEAYATHEQHYPNPGWVEHDPTEIWTNARRVVGEALDEAGVDAGDLAALGVANQRETTVVWDAETGEPVHDAVVWQDRRTTDRVEELRDESDWIRARTGLPVDAYFSATKVEWILDEVDGIRDRARRGEVSFGTVDSWLVYKLTGEHVTDVTNASRTMLFDVHDLTWDEELLAEFGVPQAMLPEVRPSSDETPYGYTTEFGADVPVTAALGDQQAALFGQACFEAGEAKTTYGTGAFLLRNTGTEPVESDNGLVTTVAVQRSGEPARYALEGSIFATGGAIEWLVDVGLVDDASETASLAAAVDSTDDVYVVPAFAGLGAPYWDGRARGTVVGLTRGTSREQIVRAVLEAIAYRTRDVVEATTADTGRAVDRLRVDGGAVANDVLCGIQADVLDAAVVRPAIDETTALGAAYAAGLAVDYWDSLDALRAVRRVDRTFEPSADYDREYERWRAAVERSRGWAVDGADRS